MHKNHNNKQGNLKDIRLCGTYYLHNFHRMFPEWQLCKVKNQAEIRAQSRQNVTESFAFQIQPHFNTLIYKNLKSPQQTKQLLGNCQEF